MALLDRFNDMGLLVKDSFKIELGWDAEVAVEDSGHGEFCIAFPLVFFNNFTKIIPMLEKVDSRLGSLRGYEVDLPNDFEDELAFIRLHGDPDNPEDMLEKIEFPGPNMFYLTKDTDEMRFAPLAVGEETPIGDCSLRVENEIMPGQSEEGALGIYCYKSIYVTVGGANNEKESDGTSIGIIKESKDVVPKEPKKKGKKKSNKKK